MLTDKELQAILEDEHVLLLMPTKNAIESLHNSYKNVYKASLVEGHKSKIFTLEQWVYKLTDIVNSAKQNFLFLTQAQQQLWWQNRVLNKIDYKLSFSQLCRLANKFQATYALTKKYNINLHAVTSYVNDDSQELFVECAEEFNEYCVANNYYIIYDLINYLSENISIFKGYFPKFQKIYLLNFLEISPNIEKMLKVVTKTFGVVFEQKYIDFGISPKTLISDNENHEIKAASLWAKDKKIKGFSVALIFPELKKFKSSITKQLLNHLSYQDFNLIYAHSYSDYSLIKSLSLVFKILEKEISKKDAVNFISNPFFFENQITFVLKDNIANKLRNIQNDYLDFGLLKKYCVLDSNLYQSICHLENIFNSWETLTLHPNEWITEFIELLDMLKWPGSSLDVDNYNIFAKLPNVWRAYLSTSEINPLQTKKQFFSNFSNILNQELQLENFNFNKIQISSCYDFAGATFDYIWVLRLNDANWPNANMSASSLLPYEIVKKHQISNSTPEIIAEESNRILKLILGGGREETILSSSSAFNNSIVTPIPLLDNLKPYSMNDLNLVAENACESKYASSIQEIVHEKNLPLTDFEIKKLSGGSSLVKDISNCYFKAFAKYRLKAEYENDLRYGLDSATTGRLLHIILAKFWQAKREDSSLNSENLLDNIMSLVISEQLKKYDGYQKNNIMDLEYDKLRELANLVINCDMQRSSFIVSKIEESIKFNFGPITLTLILDRVDEVSGKNIVIDYKTGICSVSDWFKERIKNPQLILYLLATDADAIAYYDIKQEKAKLIGGAKHDDMEVQKIDEWEQQITAWRAKINLLAEDFTKGRYYLNPIDEQVCSSCDFINICRLRALDNE